MLNEQQTAEQMMQAKGRMVFLLMLTFFVVPIIVVILMYQLNWKPEGASAGELVKPPRLLQIPTALTSNQATPQNHLLWKEKWSIVYLAAACEATCMQKLSDMRQLHVSLYKDIPRTQRILLTNTQNITEIKRLFPDLIVVNQPSADVAQLMQQFSVNESQPATSQHLYLVDPLGHLMMRYESNVPLASVRKDVARLLRYSWAG